MRPRHLLWLLPPLLIAALALAWQQGWLRPPRAYDPFAPLHLRDPVTFVTGLKLTRLAMQPAICSAALASAQLDVMAVDDRDTGDGCGLSNAVRVAAAGSETGLRFNASFLASCPLAVAWAMFERHGLQPLAQQHFGQAVTQLHHLGTYSCRNIRGGEGNIGRRRSEHATANALDLAALTLADGKRIAIRQDWLSLPRAQQTDEAAFLRALRDEACRFFRVVLGPDYNAAHADHLHLDMGGFSMCR